VRVFGRIESGFWDNPKITAFTDSLAPSDLPLLMQARE